MTAASATSRPTSPTTCRPSRSEGGGCGCAFAPDSKELAYTYKDLDPVPAISTSAEHLHPQSDRPGSEAGQGEHVDGGNFDPAYSPDGKYLAWRSQARAGYESDKFRLMLYDRAAKTTKDVLKDARLPNWAPANFDLWVDEFAWSFTSADGVRHYYSFLKIKEKQTSMRPTWMVVSSHATQRWPASGATFS